MNLFKHIFILLLPYTICLAANSTIQGYITDSKTGEALIGANIMLMDTNMGIASDLDGAYIISDVPIGSYTLLAMFIGYDNLEKIIRVEADQKYIINISLKPTAIEIQETKVTAKKMHLASMHHQHIQNFIKSVPNLLMVNG